MRNECLSYTYTYESKHPVERLVQKIASKSAQKTNQSGGRPYGVGLLVIGQDQSGPHLFETAPDGNFYEYIAYAIGSRSQSAKTYLEKHYKNYQNATLEQLVSYGLKAIQSTVDEEEDFNKENLEIATLEFGKSFRYLNNEEK